MTNNTLNWSEVQTVSTDAYATFRRRGEACANQLVTLLHNYPAYRNKAEERREYDRQIKARLSELKSFYESLKGGVIA